MQTNLIEMTICIVVFVLFTFLQNLISSKRVKRARLALLPILSSVIVTIAVTIVINKADSITAVIKQFDYKPIDNTLIVFSNIIVIVLYIILKLAIRPAVSAIWKDDVLTKATSSYFYEYSKEYDRWFLQNKWANFRKLVLAIVFGLVAVTSLFVGHTWIMGPKSFIWINAYPVAALVVFTEVYGFINGLTKSEFENSFLGEEADARRISNFYKIREVFESILPDQIITAHTGFENVGNSTPIDYLNKLRESEDRIDNITADFFLSNERYTECDVDSVVASVQLMHNENVVFLNPFYRDLGNYVTLPIVSTLLSGKKCLVVSGRKSSCKDIKDWLSDTISTCMHFNGLWRAAMLSDKEPECEIGIIGFQQLYDNRIIETNKDFFTEVKFVLLIEPSIITTTGQVGLSILARLMCLDGDKPTYCICDRNADGLVDTISHVLLAEFTKVVAPPIPRCIYTGMTWNVDGDFLRQSFFEKQTRYLGNGTELAALAIKNQIPHVSWFSGTKSPIKDIQWIVGQSFPTICKFMNIEQQQKSITDRIEFNTSLWGMPKRKEEFIIAEDEFCNMFTVLRAFLSRGSMQSFVNVLSENYLLRDYMRCNKQMFISSPNAIPSIVPEYAKTERNVLIKLLLTMVNRPVSEAEVINEYNLVGIYTDDAYNTLLEAISKYTFAPPTALSVHSIKYDVDEYTTLSAYEFSITKDSFSTHFADSLKNAYFIIEDENDNNEYIDAKLFNHVSQIVLPGQYITYEGKYYQVKRIVPEKGVVLRRASNCYDGRKYYRQIREYSIAEFTKDDIINTKTVMDIEISYISCDIGVKTIGYIELDDFADVRNARRVHLADDPEIESFERTYKNKQLLRIGLPDSDDRIRYTLCLLLLEVFRSIFPEGWHYLAPMAAQPKDIEGILGDLVYSVNGDVSDQYIYIVEDSTIDLGLLEAFDKNFMKIMEIIADFLDWHFEKMREPAYNDPEPVSVIANIEENEDKSLISRIAMRIRRLFGLDKKDDEETEVEIQEKELEVEDENTEETSDEVEYSLDDSTEKSDNLPETEFNISEEEEYSLGDEGEAVSDDMPITTSSVVKEIYKDMLADNQKTENEIDEEFQAGLDVFEGDTLIDDPILDKQFDIIGLSPINKTRYQKECYLKYGFDEIDTRLKIEEVEHYLRARGWTNNAFTKARKRDVLSENLYDTTTMNHCDFCGFPINGVSYTLLNDGRVCCNNCSTTAIESIDELREIFTQAANMLEVFFGVRCNVPIRVITGDAKKVAKGVKFVFKPSTEQTPRVLGYATRKQDDFSIVIENGSPRLVAVETIIHELTHIWQYIFWKENAINTVFKMGKDECTARASDILHEGMAGWVSLQFLYQIGETSYAAKVEANLKTRKDIYGVGFSLFAEQYPVVRDSSVLKNSPFKSFPPLEPEKVKEASKILCPDQACSCE